MRKLIFIVFYLVCINYIGIAQNRCSNQKYLLSQYIGTWFSADSLTDETVGDNPKIKAVVTPKLESSSLEVEIFENKNQNWTLLMVELISYDSLTNQIVAIGQKSGEPTFIGKGGFINSNHWVMNDINFKGDSVLNVTFNFINNKTIILEGSSPNSSFNWKIKYLKNNTMDKNIGIQLVSVRDAMVEDPAKTLQALGEIGYSFIETFVYNNRMFYGMSPLSFKALVEKNGMKFLGSMTFQDLPADGNWKATLPWWKECIDDHVEAGVSYLTTSNNEIKKITSLKHLKQYCEYYNAIGKLCKEKGIQFGLHNHAEEFGKLEGITIYDYLIENTDPELVSFQSDLYWMKVGGVDPISYFKKYPGRFFSWHVKEDGELGASGKINFEQIFSYSQLAGLKYNLVEVEKFNYLPLKSVDLSYQYLFNSDFVKCYK